MYEKPMLVYAGTASAVVLGISMYGADPDGSDFPIPFEFGGDTAENIDDIEIGGPDSLTGMNP